MLDCSQRLLSVEICYLYQAVLAYTNNLATVRCQFAARDFVLVYTFDTMHLFHHVQGPNSDIACLVTSNEN